VELQLALSAARKSGCTGWVRTAGGTLCRNSPDGRGIDSIDADYVHFTGDSTDYSIVKSGGTAAVVWAGAGSGGCIDTLTNVEFLVFHDVTLGVLVV
jgi:hypothetical protein